MINYALTVDERKASAAVEALKKLMEVGMISNLQAPQQMRYRIRRIKFTLLKKRDLEELKRRLSATIEGFTLTKRK